MDLHFIYGSHHATRIRYYYPADTLRRCRRASQQADPVFMGVNNQTSENKKGYAGQGTLGKMQEAKEPSANGGENGKERESERERERNHENPTRDQLRFA
jgi:hypothetical protein